MGTITDLRQHGGANAYLANCPSRTVLEVLANKWTALTIGALSAGPKRFGELRRILDGITQKMLTQTLRALERDGLVTRTMYPSIPPRVDYELTELGHTVSKLFAEIREWAETHAVEILTARERYDSRPDRELEPVR